MNYHKNSDDVKGLYMKKKNLKRNKFFFFILNVVLNASRIAMHQI